MPDLTYGANYTFDLVPGLLRLLALDTNDTTGGSPGMVRQGTVDHWLRPELERAQSDGVLVFLASHHPTTDINTSQGELGAPVADALTAAQIEALIASYPNVVVWLVGHEHDNRVRAIHGADATHPGYWEVETGAIADWPSESRVIELVDNGNGTLSLFGTLVDFDTRSCMERRYRRLAMMDYLAAWDRDHTGTANDRNVELVIPVPSGVAAHLAAASATAPTRIESETTLAGMR
jgi:hypothetical protein